MGCDIPKQYLEVNDLPIFMYSYTKFAAQVIIDSIVIVIDPQWKPFVEQCLEGAIGRNKVRFAYAGSSRQQSVFNGMNLLREYASNDDIVLVHDAVRPLFDVSLIQKGIEGCKHYDAALPVVNTKDTIVVSENGILISGLLNRETLFSGQTPEVFKFGRFWEAHIDYYDELDGIRGGLNWHIKLE